MKPSLHSLRPPVVQRKEENKCKRNKPNCLLTGIKNGKGQFTLSCYKFTKHLSPPSLFWYKRCLVAQIKDNIGQLVGRKDDILKRVSLLTGVLGVLTSFFSCSSSIFKISLSDISRAILAVRGNQDQNVKMSQQMPKSVLSWFSCQSFFKSSSFKNTLLTKKCLSSISEDKFLNHQSLPVEWRNPQQWEKCVGS